MTVQTEDRPRVLSEVRFTAPLAELESAVFRWASSLGHGAVFTTKQLNTLRERLEKSGRDAPCDMQLSMDIHLALGALQGRQRAPAGGWAAYVSSWEEQLLNTALGYGTQLDQLRALQDLFGGILLNGRQAAFVLLIPCEDGTWVKMGWNTIALLESSPFDDSLHQKVLDNRHVKGRGG